MNTKRISRLFLMLVGCLLLLGFPFRNNVLSLTALSSPLNLDAATASSLLFVENVGQFPESVRFLIYGSNQDQLWLTEKGVWLTQEDAERGQVTAIRLTFSGASDHPQLVPFGARETVFNYYHGNDPTAWVGGAPVWSGVRYVDLYPGVDLIIAGDGEDWTWRLASESPAALSDVRLLVEGAEAVNLTDDVLHLATNTGDLTLPLLSSNCGVLQHPPAVISVEDTIYNITSPFVSSATHQLSRNTQPVLNVNEGYGIRNASPFPQADQDLLFSTFLGGSSDDRPRGMTVNANGEVYVTGSTESPGFPTTPGAYDTSFDGDSEIFVAQLNAEGSDLVYGTFLGGTAVMTETVNETGWDIAVDDSGMVYVAGESSTDDFPTTPGAYSETHIPADPADVFPDSPPASDIVIVKLDASGALVYGTYFAPPLTGGGGTGMAVDASGVVYLAGEVAASDFPTTEGAFNRSFGYSTDFFVLKFNPAGQGENDLLYSTYVHKSVDPPLGPRGWEDFGDMTLKDGVVYVIGSTDYEFPTTTSAYDTTFNGTLPCQSFPCLTNVVFFKLDPAGNGTADLLYSTYLGGTTPISDQRGEGIAVDDAGVVYLTGSTWAGDFPTTPGAFDTTHDGSYNDGFVSKLNPAGNGTADLLYSTFLGGGYIDNGGYAIAVDDAGDIYVVGDTYSDDFPVTLDAYQRESQSYTDVTVSRLRPQGAGAADLIYGTFLGGDELDYGRDIVLGEQETVYVAGYTESSDFPTTDGAYDTSHGGGTCYSNPCEDVFVAKLDVKPSYMITGTVVDADGQPLLGVQVAADGTYVGTTGTNGRYTISDLQPGTYTLTPLTSGYLWSPPSRTVTIPPSVSAQNFVGAHMLKESAIPEQQVLDYGDPLTYTVRLLYPEDRDVVFYDPVPTYTTYISGSLVAPPELAYRSAAPAISGTLHLSDSITTTLTFAVQVAITGTADFGPHIINQACVYPTDGGLADCEWSNEVSNITYMWSTYLPLIVRDLS